MTLFGPTPAEEQALARWRAAWPAAQAAWGRYTRLHEPAFCVRAKAARALGLEGSFAMIRLTDQSVVVDLEATQRLGLDDFAVEILAHEVGHHVLAPGNTRDHVRCLARIRRALPTLEAQTARVANLYTDLFINDRLQRQAGLRMVDVYRRLQAVSRAAAAVAPAPPARPPKAPPAGEDRVWSLYMAIYEQLWRLDRGELGSDANDEALQADAWLGARLVRVYADEWLAAAGRFASLLLPYLVAEQGGESRTRLLQDTAQAGAGADVSGAVDVEADEAEGAIHPSDDERIVGAGVDARVLEDDLDGGDAPSADAPASASGRSASGAGQAREPFEYGEILRAAGVRLSDHDIAVHYYRHAALPHLVPFPRQQQPAAEEPELEGFEPWNVGDAVDDVDWLQTVLQSPQVIPGVTTVKRRFADEPGTATKPRPLDLDLYVDSSGSMPNPQQSVSYLALAGAVIALSALRAGSSVQATLWSGAGQTTSTSGFVRDENAVLRALTAFYGGATAFPIHTLRDTWSERPATAPPGHILMISDDGITTMFADDERGGSGWNVAASALSAARGGGTMALNVDAGWRVHAQRHAGWQADLLRAEREQGWHIAAIEQLEDLLAFAREFARRHYAPTSR